MPQQTIRADPAIHLVSCGVKSNDLVAYSIMCGAFVVFIFALNVVAVLCMLFCVCMQVGESERIESLISFSLSHLRDEQVGAQ